MNSNRIILSLSHVFIEFDGFFLNVLPLATQRRCQVKRR